MATMTHNAPAGANNPSTSADPVLTAFERWQANHAARKLLASDAGDANLWPIIEAAEEEIRAGIATTPQGIAAMLWVALAHSPAAEDELAATRADLAWYEAQGDALDWNVRLTVSAIRSLQAMANSEASPTARVDKAVEDYQQAARIRSFNRALDAYRAARRALAQTPVEDEEASDAAIDALWSAEAWLFHVSAPDVAGLLAKLDAATRDDTANIPDEYFASIREDLMRMSGATISPVFLPHEWLDTLRRFGGSARAIDGKLCVTFDRPKAAEHVAKLTEEERNAIIEHLAESAEHSPAWQEALAQYRRATAREAYLRAMRNNADRMPH